LNKFTRSAFQSEKPQIVRCDTSDSSRSYGRVAQRARCGFSGETHTGRAFAGSPPRLGSLIWNDQTTLTQAKPETPAKAPSRPRILVQRFPSKPLMMSMPRNFAKILPGLLLVLVLPLRAELRPLELPAESGSLAPTWTSLADGRVVLTWLQRMDQGHAFRFSVLDDEGFGGAGEIARGADWFANWADMPGLVEMPGGQWLAHWLVKSGAGTYSYDVVMAISSDQGASWSEPFSPHDDGTPTEHGFVSYFSDDGEGAGVVWLDGRETGGASHDDHDHSSSSGAMTLRSATVDKRGQVLQPHLLDARVCDCCQTASVLTDLGPLVIYRGRSSEEVRDIRVVRRLNGQWTEPRTLHQDDWTIAACPVNGPALIGRNNRVVAAWFTMAQNQPRVQVAISMDSGASFSLTATLGQDQALGRVDLAWWQDGFALVWLDQVGGQTMARLARFNADAELLWQRDLVSVDGSRISGFPRLASPDGERLLLSWTEPDSDNLPRIRVAEFKADLEQSTQ